MHWLHAAALALVVSTTAHMAGGLTQTGLATAAVLGFLVYGSGGWVGSLPMVTFFVTATAMGRLGSPIRQSGAHHAPRSATQVLANGLVGTLCCLWAFTGSSPSAFGACIGAFAAANADTWATEIGVRFGACPRSIVSGKRVESGESGGVTLVGLIAAFAGGGAVGLTALFGSSWLAVPTFAAIGFTGSFLDSVLGASAQERYVCQVCGRAMENRVHCGQITRRTGGIPWVTNDSVNFFCTATGAALGALVAVPFNS